MVSVLRWRKLRKEHSVEDVWIGSVLDEHRKRVISQILLINSFHFHVWQFCCIIFLIFHFWTQMKCHISHCIFPESRGFSESRTCRTETQIVLVKQECLLNLSWVTTRRQDDTILKFGKVSFLWDKHWLMWKERCGIL